MKRFMAFILVLSIILAAQTGNWSINKSAVAKDISSTQLSKDAFVHPGILHIKENFEAVKKNIENNVSLTVTAWIWIMAGLLTGLIFSCIRIHTVMHSCLSL